MEVKNYYYPKNVNEAIKLLRKKEAIFPIAGGTSFFLFKNKKADSFVDVTRIGLNYIKESRRSIIIGAGATLREISKFNFTSQLGKSIGKITSRIATCQLRNVITIGGNVVQVYKWSDMPVIFMALNAKFKMHGNKTLNADSFFKKHPRTILKKDELLIDVTVPIESDGYFGCERYTRTETDFIILAAATYFTIKDNTVRNARIVIGGASILPQRMIKAENYLLGKRVEDTTINLAARHAGEELKISRDIRVNSDYKRELASILTKRAIKNAHFV